MLEKLKNEKIGTVVGIAIICLFSSIYMAASYYAIDNGLSKFGPGYERLYVNK